MRLSNGFVIDKEKTFGELKFTAVRDVFLQNEDGTPSTQLKKRIYDLKCSLHGGIIPVSVQKHPYGKVVDKVLVAGSDTVSFIPNLTHKSITPFWVRKKQSIIRLTAIKSYFHKSNTMQILSISLLYSAEIVPFIFSTNAFEIDNPSPVEFLALLTV